MKITLVLSHELYLRNFAGVIQGLCDAGHFVTLAFSAKRNQQQQAIEELLASAHNLSIVDAPDRSGWWWPVSDVFRVIADYTYSLDPAFDGAWKMRERSARRVPSAIRRLISAANRLRLTRHALTKFLQWIERSISTDDAVVKWLEDQQSDLVLVSPLIDMNYAQMEVLKSARSLGIITGCLVASWDNLTMKGKIQIAPDYLVVWNKHQIAEAQKLHGLSTKGITETGAQLYDHWFDAKPDLDKEQFCSLVGGLDPAQSIILYTGSSPFICPDELTFFREWYDALRNGSHSELAKANILVRPHPLHAAQWQGLQDLEKEDSRLSVWPRQGAMPLVDDAKQRYFDSLWHACAVVGVNTSAFWEAGIIGRQTYSFKNKYFQESQQGTLHFSYITESGVVKIADTLEIHLDDITAAVQTVHKSGSTIEPNSYIAQFLRPKGIDQPATPLVVQAVEQMTASNVPKWRSSRLALLCRILIWPLAVLGLRKIYLARVS